MTQWNLFVFKPIWLLALLMGSSLSFSGCCSLPTDGGFGKDGAAVLLDLDSKTPSHALTSLQETPSFMAPGEKRPVAMLLDMDSGGATGDKSTPMPIREQAPAAVR